MDNRFKRANLIGVKNTRIFILLLLVFYLSIKFLINMVFAVEDDSLKKATLYEEKGYYYYNIAKNYYQNKDYKYSSLNYTNSISYLTLAYIIYLDKLNNKDKFLKISKDVLFFSNELNIALSKINDKSKIDSINSIYASNYLNMAATLQKIYATDPPYSIEFYKKEYLYFVNKLQKESPKVIEKPSENILIQIALYYQKSIVYYLMVNDYDKAQKSLEDLKKFADLVKLNEIENIVKESEKKLKNKG